MTAGMAAREFEAELVACLASKERYAVFDTMRRSALAEELGAVCPPYPVFVELKALEAERPVLRVAVMLRHPFMEGGGHSDERVLRTLRADVREVGRPVALGDVVVRRVGSLSEFACVVWNAPAVVACFDVREAAG